MITEDDLTRVNNDSYGNPRYIVHYLNLLSDTEIASGAGYTEALEKARGGNKFAGKAYRGRDFGGGIVFTTYDTSGLVQFINECASVEA